MNGRNDDAPMADGERDAWLREALRHAPDAHAAPPSDVSAAILAQAHAASRVGAAASSATRPRHALLALWDWLARPPVAAGFASVMAATLVGLMWWDRPLDETLPPRPEMSGSPAKPSPRADGSAPAQDAASLERRGAQGDPQLSDPGAAPAPPPPALRTPEVAIAAPAP
ncbi:MAG: hypothetical protein JO090_06530, partial [Rhizobacter sp.]|nr:hypothetical protein [Rhizobacter sp.]